MRLRILGIASTVDHFPGFDSSATRSKSVTRDSIPPISIAFSAWLRMASAARTRTDGGVFGSMRIFKSVVAAAVVPCCNLAIDRPKATLAPFGTRRRTLAASSNAGGFWPRCRRIWRLRPSCVASATRRSLPPACARVFHRKLKAAVEWTALCINIGSRRRS